MLQILYLLHYLILTLYKPDKNNDHDNDNDNDNDNEDGIIN